MKKSAAEAHQNALKYLWWGCLVKEHVVSSFNASRTVILTSKIMLCIWWDQLGVVYYELLKPTETTQAIGIERNWCVWAEHWKIDVCNTSIFII